MSSSANNLLLVFVLMWPKVENPVMQRYGGRRTRKGGMLTLEYAGCTPELCQRFLPEQATCHRVVQYNQEFALDFVRDAA